MQAMAEALINTSNEQLPVTNEQKTAPPEIALLASLHERIQKTFEVGFQKLCKYLSQETRRTLQRLHDAQTPIGATATEGALGVWPEEALGQLNEVTFFVSSLALKVRPLVPAYGYDFPSAFAAVYEAFVLEAAAEVADRTEHFDSFAKYTKKSHPYVGFVGASFKILQNVLKNCRQIFCGEEGALLAYEKSIDRFVDRQAKSARTLCQRIAAASKVGLLNYDAMLVALDALEELEHSTVAAQSTQKGMNLWSDLFGQFVGCAGALFDAFEQNVKSIFLQPTGAETSKRFKFVFARNASVHEITIKIVRTFKALLADYEAVGTELVRLKFKAQFANVAAFCVHQLKNVYKEALDRRLAQASAAVAVPNSTTKKQEAELPLESSIYRAFFFFNNFGYVCENIPEIAAAFDSVVAQSRTEIYAFFQENSNAPSHTSSSASLATSAAKSAATEKEGGLSASTADRSLAIIDCMSVSSATERRQMFDFLQNEFLPRYRDFSTKGAGSSSAKKYPSVLDVERSIKSAFW